MSECWICLSIWRFHLHIYQAACVLQLFVYTSSWLYHANCWTYFVDSCLTVEYTGEHFAGARHNWGLSWTFVFEQAKDAALEAASGQLMSHNIYQDIVKNKGNIDYCIEVRHLSCFWEICCTCFWKSLNSEKLQLDSSVEWQLKLFIPIIT
jgi:hypothetical protein